MIISSHGVNGEVCTDTSLYHFLCLPLNTQDIVTTLGLGIEIIATPRGRVLKNFPVFHKYKKDVGVSDLRDLRGSICIWEKAKIRNFQMN